MITRHFFLLLAIMVVAVSVEHNYSSAQAQSPGPVLPYQGPCGYAPPTPSPSFDVVSPSFDVTAHTSGRIVITASGIPYVVTLLTDDQVLTLESVSSGITTGSGNREFRYKNLKPRSTYVIGVQYAHWVPGLPCSGPEARGIGLLKT